MCYLLALAKSSYYLSLGGDPLQTGLQAWVDGSQQTYYRWRN